MMRFARAAMYVSASNEVYLAREDDSKPEVVDHCARYLPIFSLPNESSTGRYGQTEAGCCSIMQNVRRLLKRAQIRNDDWTDDWTARANYFFRPFRGS